VNDGGAIVTDEDHFLDARDRDALLVELARTHRGRLLQRDVPPDAPADRKRVETL